MKNELLVINPKEYGLEEKQAEKMTSGLAVVLSERKALEEIYDAVILKELNADTFKEARELRLKVQKNRTTGIEAWHKTNKAFYLAGGRFVDAYKNKEVVVNEQMEERLLEIEKYEEKLASEAKAKIKAEREALLAPYEVDTTYVSLVEMTEEQFNAYLATNKLAFETKKEQEKQSELARIEAEKKAEAEEKERQRLAKIEQDKKDAELKELQAKQALREKRAEELKPYIVFIRDYNNLIELPEKEYKEQLAGVKKGAELQWESDRKIQEEQAKNRREEIALAKKLEEENNKLKQQQEQEKTRIEAEEAERLAKEKALLLAPDKDKVKVFFEKFKALEFPELESEAGKAMSVRVKEALQMVKQLIIDDSKTLL